MWSIIQRWTGERVSICLQSTPLCVVQISRASAAVGERLVAHVLHKWFRRQRGALEEENKFITLPYLHITPQRPVREDSGEMSGPHPLPKTLLGEAQGWTCHLQFSPLDPWPPALWGHRSVSNSLCSSRRAQRAQLSCSLPNSISRFCACICVGCRGGVMANDYKCLRSSVIGSSWLRAYWTRSWLFQSRWINN